LLASLPVGVPAFDLERVHLDLDGFQFHSVNLH
jgi:hypothetical protein